MHCLALSWTLVHSVQHSSRHDAATFSATGVCADSAAKGGGQTKRASGLMYQTTIGLTPRSYEFRPVVVWHQRRAVPFLAVWIGALTGEEAVLRMFEDGDPR